MLLLMRLLFFLKDGRLMGISYDDGKDLLLLHLIILINTVIHCVFFSWEVLSFRRNLKIYYLYCHRGSVLFIYTKKLFLVLLTMSQIIANEVFIDLKYLMIFFSLLVLNI